MPARASEPVPLQLFEETIRLQRAVRGAIDAELQPLRLRIQEYRALSELRANPAISGVELARRLQHSPQAVQPLLTRLEDGGLIERRLGLTKSNRESSLTERGEEVLLLADRIVAALTARVNNRLHTGTIAALLHLIEAAESALERTRGAGADSDDAADEQAET